MKGRLAFEALFLAQIAVVTVAAEGQSALPKTGMIASEDGVTRNNLLNYCYLGGYTAGPGQEVPTQGWRYNWGRAGIGCNNLVCRECGQKVSNHLLAGQRTYSCPCWGKYSYDQLDCLGEDRFAGPMDYPVQRPPWQCAGHPTRPMRGSKPKLPLKFNDLDAAYNSWKGTDRAAAIALEFSGMAAQHPECCALFYSHNPDAPGHDVLLEIIPEAGLANIWCKALSAHGQDFRFLQALRGLALRPGFTKAALPCLSSDRDWLSGHVGQIMEVDPSSSRVLCRMLANHSYGWDQTALRNLPIELLRTCAGEFGRCQLQAGEADVYWERDYAWIVENYAKLQAQSSDFGSYIDDFLKRKGWSPDEATLVVWRQQAVQMNENYNALPHLVRWDRAWVEEHFEAILSVRYPVRGLWLLNLLEQSGSSKLAQLREVVKARTPGDF